MTVSSHMLAPFKSRAIPSRNLYSENGVTARSRGKTSLATSSAREPLFLLPVRFPQFVRAGMCFGTAIPYLTSGKVCENGRCSVSCSRWSEVYQSLSRLGDFSTFPALLFTSKGVLLFQSTPTRPWPWRG